MQAPSVITYLFFGLFAISTTACSNSPTPPSDLLLTRDDFPTEVVIETIKEPGATNNDEPAVQVELKTPGFTILESLVLFETSELALAILADINQDHAAIGIVSDSIEGFDKNSGIRVDHLDGEQASTFFFVEGRALVKITVRGDIGIASIWEIARRAREKVEG